MHRWTLPHQRNWQTPLLRKYECAQLLRRDATLEDIRSGCFGRLCYLATPYTKVARHDDGQWDAVESLECGARAGLWARRIGLQGVTAISPIVQAVEMVHASFVEPNIDPLDVGFWTKWCRPLLQATDVVIVPPIAGWDQSDGVWLEVCAALETNRAVYLLSERGQ